MGIGARIAHIGGAMDFVVLAGTIGSDVPWARGFPRPLLPLGDGRTLLDALLGRFDMYPDALSAVCANGHTDIIEAYAARGDRQKPIVLFEEGVPLGTAGCLRQCASHLKTDRFFLASGTTWLAGDPQAMLEQHRSSGNTMTVFCTQEPGSETKGRRRLTPTGIYCCEREALKFIRPAGYQDLKEQWVPAIRRAGLRVGAVVVSEASGEIRAWSNYIRVLTESINAAKLSDRRSQMAAPGVWIGRGSKVSASARIVGPVVLGQGCEIGDDTLLVGPVVLGDGCRVGSGSRLVRVVAPGRVAFGADSSVSDRLIPPWDATAGPRLLAAVNPEGSRMVRFGAAAMSGIRAAS